MMDVTNASLVLGSLRLTGPWSPWLVIGGAIVAALAVAWLYLRETRTLASPYNFLLPGLRASAVALVILVLAGPVWHTRQTIGTLGRVIFAVDVSESMSTNDSGGDANKPSRLDRATEMLGGDRLGGQPDSVAVRPGWIQTLGETHEIDVVAFSSGSPTVVWSSREVDVSKIDESWDAVDWDASGRRTDLASGIATMANLLPVSDTSGSDANDSDPDDSSPSGDDRAGAANALLSRSALVVLSDGRHNAGPSPVDLAESLAVSGAEVYTVGLGSPDEPPDVAITRVERPETVAADGKLAGTITLRQFGMDDQPLVLRVESAGGDVAWQETLAPSASEVRSVPFELDIESIIEKMGKDSPRGVRMSTVVMDLRAVIQPVDGDTTTANNIVDFRVAASSGDRQLLILDGSSRWEMRYIRNLFTRDPAWSVDTVLFGPGTDMPRLERGEEPGQFPKSREAISRYDAIVLGEIPAEQFEPADADLIRGFVTRGGGLIVIDGRYDRVRQLATDSLTDLIPVKFTGDSEPLIAEVRTTRMGVEHPVMNLWGQSDQVAELWSELPPPISAVRVVPQEGAEVWAEIQTTDGRTSPWLVTRLFGAGRVFYLSSDQTWRWRYKVADRFHARFWNQLVASVMQPPYSVSDDYVAIGTDKIEYAEGEAATVRARLQDASGAPVGDSTVDALLIADNQVVATVPLSIDDPDRGTYQGQTGSLPPGKYEVRIRASGFDADALRAGTPIWIGSRDAVEWNRVGLDANGLTQIATSGGGIYVHESSADAILDRLRPLSGGQIIESDYPLWQSYLWFWAVILLLAAEWWLRKRAGLV